MSQAKFVFLVSDLTHPSTIAIFKWIETHPRKDEIQVCENLSDLPASGSILFLVSLSLYVPASIREKFNETLVFHASDLPLGRGWSPYIWDILEGKNEVVLSMIRAEDSIDTGDIFAKVRIPIEGTQIFEEVIAEINTNILALADTAIRDINAFTPQRQEDIDIEPTYFPKRTPDDSQLDITLPLIDQFNLLRMCDNKRFPAYFIINGVRFNLHLHKTDARADNKKEYHVET